MTPILNQATITADGEYSFEALQPTREVLLEWCITAGTATVTAGYKNLDGTFSPARSTEGTVPAYGAEGGTCRVVLPNSATAVLKVEDAADLSMIVCQNLIRD